ncbi:MAG: AAA family ATPase [Tepidisphaeraceae bacterium]
MTTGISNEKGMAFYTQFMSSEALTLASSQIINKVPNIEPWKSVVGKNNEVLSDLASNLKVTYPRNTQILTVEYANPDAKIASAGVKSIIIAYQAQYQQNSGNKVTGQIDEAERRRKKAMDDSDTAEKAIIAVTGVYGTPDLSALNSAAQNKVETIEKELRGWESNYKNATDAIIARRDSNGKLSTSELAEVEPVLAKSINELRDMKSDYAFQAAQLGANHPKVRTTKQAIEFKQQAIDALADTLRSEILAIIPDMSRGGGDKVRLTAGDLKLLEQRVTTLKTELDLAKKERDKIASAAAQVATQQQNQRIYANSIKELDTLLENLRYQAAASGTLDVVQDGSWASKASDKKILFGLAGAIGGACVPVALLMLMGLMDTRFRYSDDAAGQSMAGIPLLGILPNLPDRLSDPAQASIAAHCVHQIRTMLQLNSMREHSTAFAITSASSGDGKTSLSLALGLSFAASGSRTLLIDADLIGGGLSSRLGNETAVGIVDALAGVGLEECVQPTDVADLSLLPIGNAQAHHAGSFSPPAVRKLLAEIRKHYEVIIIDTGPVMGSIEATPVCASVDGVVLTVARGQSRPLVERAITHLGSIGAKVAGVVFNRAQHKDFEQSIGAISVRSAARSTVNGTGHNSRKNGDMGAVASAVAGSVTRDN